jgi:hypothetical protein
VITLPHRNPVPARMALCVAALALALTGLFAGSASANSVRCKGTTTPQSPRSSVFDYRFKCSEEIKGFSIVSNMSVAEFRTTADVLDPAGNIVADQTFGCEGGIPSDGFGCSGGAKNPNWVTGTFTTEGQRCFNGFDHMRTWVVAVDAAGKVSGPLPLRRPKCAKKAAKR